MQVKMMDEHTAQARCEQLSALADGELGGAELAQWMATPAAADVEATWAAYHVIGDVLRGGDQVLGQGAPGFLDRLQTRLQAEAPLVAVRPEPMPAVVAAVLSAEPAANDANFRWKMVAGFASVSALAVLTWSMVGGTGQSAMPAQLAIAAPAAAVSAQTTEQTVMLPSGVEQVMIRDARLDELLNAHRQAGGATGLPMPASFLRSAPFPAPER